MPDRFRPAPPWARRILFWLSVIGYAGLVWVGVRILTWPSTGLHPWEAVIGRVSGGCIAALALICLLSYPLHRWRWEMHGAWALGFFITIFTGVVASVDPGSVLLQAFLVISIGVYVRAVQATVFGWQTTGVAYRLKRLNAATS